MTMIVYITNYRKYIKIKVINLIQSYQSWWEPSSDYSYTRRKTNISKLWLFPMPEPNTVAEELHYPPSSYKSKIYAELLLLKNFLNHVKPQAISPPPPDAYLPPHTTEINSQSRKPNFPRTSPACSQIVSQSPSWNSTRIFRIEWNQGHQRGSRTQRASRA